MRKTYLFLVCLIVGALSAGPALAQTCSDIHATASGDGCAPSLLDGQAVTVSGIVYVPAGTYNGGSVYFQCGSGGNIFFENGATYAIGDEIEVNATVGAFGTEIQLNSASVSVLSSGNTPTAHPTATGVLGQGGDFFGDFLEVEGTLLSKDVSGFNSAYSIDDGSGVATVYVDGTTGINQATLDANIGGVVRVKGATRCDASGGPGQVLPRMDADIEIVSPPPPPPPVACGSEVHGTVDGCAPSPLAGQLVTTYGVVYVPAGTYNSGSVYYQCEDGGLLFFMNGAPYAIGDEIKVVGSVGAFGDEIQMDGVSVEVLSTGNMPMPHYMSTSVLSAGGDFLGDFIEIQGTLAKVSGGFNATYTVDDGTGPVVMFEDGTTGIDQNRVDSFIGRTVMVRGSTKCFNGEGEILPRFDADIEMVSVPFDIRPGTCPNPLNPADKGMLPAAILGSSDLDVHNINASTLLLNGVPAEMTKYEDVGTPHDVMDACGCTADGPDGTMDLTLKFPAPAVIQTLVPVARGDTKELTLTGYTTDGRPFSASDCVLIVGKKAITGGNKDEIAPAPGSQAEEGSDNSGGGFGLSASPNGNIQRVEYAVPEASTVRLTVYDIAGRVVRRLVDTSAGAGTHTLDWNTAGMPNGVYFYRLEAAGRVATRKVVILQK
jgi:hypothetical protein